MHGRFIATSATQLNLLSTSIAFTTPSRNKTLHASALPRLPLCQRNTTKFMYSHAKCSNIIRTRLHFCHIIVFICFTFFYWVKLCLCRSNLFVYIVSTDNSNVVGYRIVRNLMALVAS